MPTQSGSYDFQAAREAQNTAANAAVIAIGADELSQNNSNQLSTIDKVVGALDWVGQYGKYKGTNDPVTIEGKIYFQKIGDDYSVYPIEPTPYSIFSLTSDSAINTEKTYYTVVGASVSPPSEFDMYLYYERENNVYTITDDTEIVSGKTYYTLTGTEVVSPSASSLGSYYEKEDAIHRINPSLYGLYELEAIDKTVSEYLYSHMEFREEEGLYIINDDNSGSILISSNPEHKGVYMLNENGDPVAIYGENTLIGNENGAHILIGENTETGLLELSFYDGEQKVAYISNKKLYIPEVVVVDALQVGDELDGAWQWAIAGTSGETARNLRLVWIAPPSISANI